MSRNIWIRKKRFIFVVCIMIAIIFGAITLSNSNKNVDSVVQETGNLQAENATPPNAPPAVTQTSDIPGFVPKPSLNGSKASYDLSLKMTDDHSFIAIANITATNVSSDSWDKLELYMIPNLGGDLKMGEVLLDDRPVHYSLDKAALTVKLPEKLPPSATTHLKISYRIKNYSYFSNDGDTYVLAQWYPMLATYRGGWNLNYNANSEFADTDFSDFTLNYSLFSGYHLVSSSPSDADGDGSSGQLKADHILEMFVVVTKGMKSESKLVGDTNIRVWGYKLPQSTSDTIKQTAGDLLSFMNEHVGPYPYKQLDIVTGQHFGNIEHPGAVTIGLVRPEHLKQRVVHELIHQWFYGMVADDPYYDGWLDEGITEFATSSYLKQDSYLLHYLNLKGKPSNLPLDEYAENEFINSLYVIPNYKLSQYFDQTPDDKTGFKFLHSYFEKYKFSHVTTPEFVRFMKAYFRMKDNSFFQSWIVNESR
ncbi:M1 family aminopeptidase [Paenibacillus lignilyticus]|uniref:Peptidase M1 membrane alanine aminopeptidase domain-containing protein n=1 Tax=Paenibacillus lignilyticus TaxID=1172615 RepID=A0ABS5C9E6_9BACL|nr:M1 family aminopeptidase [Paenibacillus lignilyticus]MBP3962619.1 hypothetical protein [Paenibacillus lignilyticus]